MKPNTFNEHLNNKEAPSSSERRNNDDTWSIEVNANKATYMQNGSATSYYQLSYGPPLKPLLNANTYFCIRGLKASVLILFEGI